MAIHRVPYTRVTVPPNPAFPAGRIASRPVLRLALTSENKRLSCYAIVDSGADHCVFPRSFLQPLGFNALTAPIEMTTGVGSTNVPTHFVNITIDLQGAAQFPVYAGFTTGLDPVGIGLLGQSGFFDRFHLHFKLSEGIYEIEI